MEPLLRGHGRLGEVIQMLFLAMYSYEYEYFELVTFQGTDDSRGIFCLLLPPCIRTGFTAQKTVDAGVLSSFWALAVAALLEILKPSVYNLHDISGAV